MPKKATMYESVVMRVIMSDARPVVKVSDKESSCQPHHVHPPRVEASAAPRPHLHPFDDLAQQAPPLVDAERLPGGP